MAQPAQKPQDTIQDPPQKISQVALKITPQAKVQETRADSPQKTKTIKTIKTTETTETAPRGAGGDEDMTNTEALDAMIKANEVMLKGVAEMQREIMDFGKTRLNEDIDTQEALSSCADLQEAIQVQTDFTQKAIQQYADEMTKLLNLSARVGRDCWSPFEDAASVVFKGVKTR